ncbi:MAG TPA: PQQ-dependent dehydrogenase, methanol/ethanol family [Steroidobacteraceae bacterium]|nr:PQQ-dependent dehydrogenase, methanol/ethanol family [Steroidobacteraceae bacterium]
MVTAAACAALVCTALQAQPVPRARPRLGSQALASQAAGDWPTPAGDADKTRFSALTDINRGNVARLGLAWAYDLGGNRVQEATPVVVGRVLYTTASLGRVFAFDAVTGRLLWSFTPKVDMQVNRTACCDQANRGLAVTGGKVIVGALDGKLYALDAASGRVVWSVDTIVDHSRGYTVSGAPEVAGDLVVIGNGGSEYDVRGYVSAYRIASGRLAWRFYVVPHDPARGPQETPALQAALSTWDPHSRWDIGGGGASWDAIVYDPRFDVVYVGTGNAGPYPPRLRSPSGGDNLYLSSIVALDRASGRLKWFYQETPRDGWDFTAVQPMILTDLAIDGRMHAVILHAPKNGFLYLIDRRTGKPLRASPLVRMDWEQGLDPVTGRPRLTPNADYGSGPRIVFPSSTGARNWEPGAYDPVNRVYYAPVVDMGNLMFTTPGAYPRRPRAMNADATLIFTPNLAESLAALPPQVKAAVEKLPELKDALANPWTSQLRAIDPLSGRTLWAVTMSGWQDRAGVLATAGGLVFQGRLDGHFAAYDASDGRLLKSIDTGSSMLAAPMTYRIDGVQYVAVGTGWGGGGWPFVPAYSAAYKYGNENRLLVFKLDGGPVPIPAPLPPLTVAPPPPPQSSGVTADTLNEGRLLFYANCVVCHANQPRSGTPDLRRLDAATHRVFDDIVLRGAMLPAGMPRWDDLLSPADAAAIHAFLIDLQGRTRAHELALQKAGKPLDAPSPVILSAF